MLPRVSASILLWLGAIAVAGPPVVVHAAPSFAAPQTVIGKQCGRCLSPVPLSSRTGDRCPHCGIRWGHESQSGHVNARKSDPMLGVLVGSIVILAALARGAVVGSTRIRDRSREWKSKRTLAVRSSATSRLPTRHFVSRAVRSGFHFVGDTPHPIVQEAMQAQAEGTEKMAYFESDVPCGDGLCSDNRCPCPEVRIPRGTGYLCIEQSLVDFRQKCSTLKSARDAMSRMQEQFRARLGGSDFVGFFRLGPILVCEQGAKLRNLDLEVASTDARHWWETGKVPLRATPSARSPGGAEHSPEKPKLLAKLKVLVAVATADGAIDPRERVYLESFCKSQGLGIDDLEKLLTEQMVVDRKSLPRLQDEKRQLVTDVFKVAAADGRIGEAERRIVGKIAVALKLSRNEIRECFEHATRCNCAPPALTSVAEGTRDSASKKSNGNRPAVQRGNAPDVLLVLTDNAPPKGADDYARRVVSELFPKHDVAVRLQITKSFRESSYIAQAALLTARLSGFEADLGRLTYRGITTADDVNATVVSVYKKS